MLLARDTLLSPPVRRSPHAALQPRSPPGQDGAAESLRGFLYTSSSLPPKPLDSSLPGRVTAFNNSR